MSKVKDDLVCEVIRVSQTNLLSKKKAQCVEGSGDDAVMDWIRMNAASYRENFKECLDSYSASELGDILNVLSQSEKDLSEVLKNNPKY